MLHVVRQRNFTIGLQNTIALFVIRVLLWLVDCFSPMMTRDSNFSSQVVQSCSSTRIFHLGVAEVVPELARLNGPDHHAQTQLMQWTAHLSDAHRGARHTKTPTQPYETAEEIQLLVLVK